MPSGKSILSQVGVTLAVMFLLNFAGAQFPQVRRVLKPNGLAPVRNAA